MTSKDIHALRTSIDRIDEAILESINRRMAVAREIGILKQRQGEPIVDPGRENRLIERLGRLNTGPLSRPDLTHIFREIIGVSRTMQELQSGAHIRHRSADAYTVIGHPVGHSLSPKMHNRAFRQAGINAVYIACDAADIGGAVAGLRALNFKGASITIPHKVAVMPHLDDLDEPARRIGAVNTITRVKERLVGSNTDAGGAVRALSDVTPLRSKRVVLIGAGGAARALGFGLVDAGAEVTFVNRTPEKGERLARELNADFMRLPDLQHIDADVLVNTTPVGMAPDSDRMPVAEHLLREDLIVMDIIYNPLKTLLLRTAEQRGCRTVSGLAMFVYQGAGQFELWTGTSAPLEAMEAAVRQALADI